SERIQQVLRNLVSNAIKFSRNGSVLMNIECGEVTRQGVKFRFEVTDTGIGIAKRDLKRIFESFTQVDSSTTGQEGGTGLGLAISRDLVQLMGGTIGADSERGKGSTFWFTLCLPEDPQAPVVSDVPANTLGGVRTLLVVGNDVSRRVIDEWLAGWGIHSVPCISTKDVLPVLREAARKSLPFNAVILDHDMIGMPTVVLGRAIKTDPDLGHTSLVMLTSGIQAWEATPRRRQYDPPPETEFTVLTKPVRQSQMLEALLASVKPAGRRANQAAHAPADAETAMQKSEQQDMAKNVRVLVVEDNTINQKVARLMLEPLGLQVDVAENGRVAVKMAKTVPYNLIFMDCQMPEMDGYEATRQIRRREGPNQRTCIIAMTANSSPTDREQCLSAGMDELIPKPIRQRHLAPILERISMANPKTDDAVDRGALLDIVAGDLEFLPGFVELFSAEFARLRTEIRTAIQNGSPDVIQRSAHELKGINLAIRAYGVVSAAELLTAMAEKQDMQGAKEACATLDRELKRVTDALNSMVKEHSGNQAC
ncbi:MAG: response regulator, partial [Armatimonadota bacterium]|nr:response regulator [Armatimonadota bacterium]